MVKMRAVLIKDGHGPSDALYIGEADKPTPKEGEIVVKVVAFGLNRADTLQRQVGYPGIDSYILGMEFSGTVHELGPGVDAFEVGQPVLGLTGGGAYAEYVAAPVGNVLVKPDELSWVQAAAIMENWLTAFQALVLISDIKRGGDVLIHAGASGVSVAALQLARLYGASKVFTNVSSEAKIQFVKSLRSGPTHAINYHTHDFVEEVKRDTGGKGVSIIVDYIGQDYFARNLDALEVDGHLVMLGLLSGANIPPDASLMSILRKRLNIHGSMLRTRSVQYQAALVARFKQEVFDHFTAKESGGEPPLQIAIYKVYPWQEVKAAHDEMEANKTQGKIILEIK